MESEFVMKLISELERKTAEEIAAEFRQKSLPICDLKEIWFFAMLFGAYIQLIKNGLTPVEIRSKAI